MSLGVCRTEWSGVCIILNFFLPSHYIVLYFESCKTLNLVQGLHKVRESEKVKYTQGIAIESGKKFDNPTIIKIF